MKNFQKTFCLCGVIAVLLSSLCAPASCATFIARNDRSATLYSNRFLKGMTKDQMLEAAEEGGMVPTTERDWVLTRIGAVADTFDCNFILGLWIDMEDANFNGTFEEFVAYLPTTGGYQTLDDFESESSIIILYVQELGESYIRVGKDITANCDISAVEAALRDTSETDNYFKTTKVIDTLAQTLRDAGAEDKYLLKCEPYAYEEQVVHALVPLREQFPGYIRVQYLDYSETHEGMAAELAQQYDDFLSYSMADAVYIAYCRNSGEAVVRIGERTGLSVKDLAAVEAAFQPVADGEDISGFTAGVSALSDALSQERGSFHVLIGGAAIVALLLAVGVVVYRKNRE